MRFTELLEESSGVNRGAMQDLRDEESKPAKPGAPVDSPPGDAGDAHATGRSPNLVAHDPPW